MEARQISTIKKWIWWNFQQQLRLKVCSQATSFQKKLNKTIKRRHQLIICLNTLAGARSSRCDFPSGQVGKGGKFTVERHFPDLSCEVINAVIGSRCWILETRPRKPNSSRMTSLLLVRKRTKTKISLQLVGYKRLHKEHWEYWTHEIRAVTFLTLATAELWFNISVYWIYYLILTDLYLWIYSRKIPL